MDSYLQWLHDTLSLLRELLSEDGSLYLHLDYHVGPYGKVVVDEVFGPDRGLNEIVWKRQTAHSDPKRFGPIHDTIWYYAKSDSPNFNLQYLPYDQSYIDSHYSLKDPDGRRYQLGDLTARGPRPGLSYTFRGFNPPPGRVWTTLPDKMEELYQSGRVILTGGATPRRKRYLDEMPGVPLQDVWTDIHPVNSQAREATEYPTQKPESLLERIIGASSRQGDLVMDCFCGSGTTAAVAEKLGRRWIASDLGRFAIHTTRKRLLGLPDGAPFILQNLGKYERQLWQAAEFGETAEAKQAAYRELILDLYHANSITGYSWLHGVKGGRMIHVGAVDSPVSLGDITQVAGEFKRAVGTGADAPKTNGVDILGWDFAFELNEVAKQKAAEANVEIRFLRIPHDVMDKRARDQGDIRFFELAALSVDMKTSERKLTLTLTDFVIPPDDVPEDVQRAITKWEQWIDYWAVDWDNKGDTFHNQWQDYRTRKKRDLLKTITHTYEEPGEYIVAVKVIDILGNDTTKTLTVKV